MATKAKEREGDAADAAPASTPTGPSLRAVSGEAGIGIARMREPFAPHHISKLPKETRAQIEARKAREPGCMVFNCKECGGHHHKDAVHLDYVGHAALTDRLLDADPHWNWEPMGWNPDGTPALDRNGGLWIKLTVCGVTRPGYGCADGKQGGDAIKEIIGDALRNAAMRFGAALDLWHKGELHPEEADEGHSKGESAVSPPASTEYAFPAGPAKNITELKALVRPLWREIKGCGDESELDGLLCAESTKAIIQQLINLENPTHRRELWEGDGKDNPGISGLIDQVRAECKVNLINAG